MDKKILTLLAVFLVVISLASVCAAELTKEQDFEGKFKMNVYDNSTFSVVTDKMNESALLSDVSWGDFNNTLVCYYEQSMDDVLSELKSNSGYMGDPKTDGNLTILEYNNYGEGSTQDYAFQYFVGVSSPENKTVFIASNDLDHAKDSANSIVFA